MKRELIDCIVNEIYDDLTEYVDLCEGELEELSNFELRELIISYLGLEF